MITEDYVSFEIAKLLKEKGFDWECIGYYVDDEPDDVKYSFCGETNSIWESRCYSAPTLQMAMKWLRKVHNIDISIIPLRSHKEYLPRIESDTISHDAIPCRKHEEACEVAIKYCLENII